METCRERATVNLSLGSGGDRPRWEVPHVVPAAYGGLVNGLSTDCSASSCWLVSMHGARTQRICLSLKVFHLVDFCWLVHLCSLIHTTRACPLP
eukprot:1158789-Pelagomonas_calceolata.AAC.10